MFYYVALISRTHAFLLERRMKSDGILCELTYMPREIMYDLCNMGVRFEENVLTKALNELRRCGLPGCRLFKEVILPNQNQYFEVQIF